jgi:hypothetical protein
MTAFVIFQLTVTDQAKFSAYAVKYQPGNI